ncbi:MAG: pirin family protein [Porticoccaceae bacterium]|nr:pirin family protein [Porticoccaceae bacterium]
MTAFKHTNLASRELQLSTPGMPASDGDGVKMTRIIGTPQLNMLDPFLLLDAFGSDKPLDYIGGFPDHPHRGFETVTYMLAGRMRHKDSIGNEGVIEAHGVQWMTAGKGIVHSEMPEQESGLLAGFQLWVNLPSKDKMCEPKYQEFVAQDVTLEQRDDGTQLRIVAGVTDEGSVGPVLRHDIEPTFMDITLAPGSEFKQQIKAGDTAFIYVIEGHVLVGHQESLLPAKRLGVLDDGDHVSLTAAPHGARLLLVAATPINESVARGGPFVMNTRDEILQAYDDFRNNRF